MPDDVNSVIQIDKTTHYTTTKGYPMIVKDVGPKVKIVKSGPAANDPEIEIRVAKPKRKTGNDNPPPTAA